jgi:TatD DNase family protein
VPNLELVDFHCHLDLYPDHAEVVSECERANVFTLAVTTTPKAWPRNYQLSSATRHVRAALGLHPQLVAERAKEIDLWEEYLPQTRYVGEVGLDAGPRFYQSFDLQKQIFERVLRACARLGDKVLSVHSVRSAKVVLDLLETYLPPSRGRVVLHWFTGSQAEARRAVDLGCYFSINAQMLANPRHCATVAALPLDRILTETDGPFTCTDGKQSKPTDIGVVIQGLARARSIPSFDMAMTIKSNFEGLVGSWDNY